MLFNLSQCYWPSNSNEETHNILANLQSNSNRLFFVCSVCQCWITSTWSKNNWSYGDAQTHRFPETSSYNSEYNCLSSDEGPHKHLKICQKLKSLLFFLFFFLTSQPERVGLTESKHLTETRQSPPFTINIPPTHLNAFQSWFSVWVREGAPRGMSWWHSLCRAPSWRPLTRAGLRSPGKQRYLFEVSRYDNFKSKFRIYSPPNCLGHETA